MGLIYEGHTECDLPNLNRLDGRIQPGSIYTCDKKGCKKLYLLELENEQLTWSPTSIEEVRQLTY